MKQLDYFLGKLGELGKYLRKLLENVQGSRLRERIETYTEAITFAEAGIDVEIKEVIKEKAKVVVVGNECTFSYPLQDYALKFAERLEYNIIALNVGPIERLESVDCDFLCEQFKKKCHESIEQFKKKCERQKIGFTHVVKFGKLDKCISEVGNEFGKVEFVLTEPEKEDGIIPVFTISGV